MIDPSIKTLLSTRNEEAVQKKEKEQQEKQNMLDSIPPELVVPQRAPVWEKDVLVLSSATVYDVLYPDGASESMTRCSLTTRATLTALT